MLAQRKVITTVAHIETSIIVLTEGGYKNAALVFLAEREITEGHCNGQRQVFQNHIGWTCHHIFLGLHLRLGELEVEMGMIVVVTGRVSAVLDVIIVILGLLSDATGKKTFALLGDNVGDIAAFGLEIVFHDT